jgi:uncharacterized membrane-anchored protein
MHCITRARRGDIEMNFPSNKFAKQLFDISASVYATKSFIGFMTVLASFFMAEARADSSSHSDASVASLNWQEGRMFLLKNKVQLRITSNFMYLASDQAKSVLKRLGNQNVDHVLGLIAKKAEPNDDSGSWFIVVSYENTGHISDEEASTLNYEKLLADIQQELAKQNETRQKEGIETVEFIGWAAPPKYDQTNHTLHWAKEIKFGNSDSNTINYNFRILGRNGVLNLNTVADISQLRNIEAHSSEILDLASFTDGNRYDDFDANIDQVAEYGLAGLIAGSIAAKAAVKVGLFKGLIAFLLAFKKMIFVAIAGLLANFKKIFSRNN